MDVAGSVFLSLSITAVWPDPVLFQARKCSRMRTTAMCAHVHGTQGKSSEMQLVMEMTSPHRAFPPATVGSQCSNNQQQHPAWTWPIHAANTHSHFQAKTALPASFNVATVDLVTWHKYRWGIKIIADRKTFGLAIVRSTHVLLIEPTFNRRRKSRCKKVQMLKYDPSIMELYSWSVSHQREIVLSFNKCYAC